ncbi:hypothetical protein HCH54_005079 [Aspergillus fumigatus]
MFTARRLLTSAPRAISRRALFHSTAPAFVQKGDAIPDLDVLVESSPGNKVNLAKELKGKGIIVGVPAAFSPACSSSHVPGYINHPKLKEAGQVFVVSVNDPFVMKAWGVSLDATGKSGRIDPVSGRSDRQVLGGSRCHLRQQLNLWEPEKQALCACR